MMRRVLNGQLNVLMLALMSFTFGITSISYTDELNFPHFDDESGTRSVDENLVNADVGEPVSAHDLGTYYKYVLSVQDLTVLSNRSFTIDEETGQLKTAVALDYERGGADLRVRVYIEAGVFDEVTGTVNYTVTDSIDVTIEVNNVNEPPTLFEGQEATSAVTLGVAEHELPGTVIEDTLKIVDPENDSFTVSLGGTDASSFSFRHGMDGGVLVAEEAFDYETQTSYSLTLTVTDEHNLSNDIAITVEITDREEDIGSNFFYPVIDENLASAIRTVLEIGDSDDLTAALMLELTSLTANNANISTLSGLQFATNLESLSVKNNLIDDITFLVALRELEELFVGTNDIEDFSPLLILHNLEKLDFSDNNTNNLNVTYSGLTMSNLTNLTYLNLKNNDIEDFSALRPLTGLVTLYISGNSLTDLSPLAGMTALTDFDITTLVEDENLAAEIRTKLELDADAVLTPARLAELTGLNAPQKEISSVKGLELATNLRSLIIWGNDIDYVYPLHGLTNLKTLNLGDNDVSDFNDLDTLSGLETLGLAGNGISDIRRLWRFPNLKRLILRNNSIDDIEVLSQLNELTYLDLRNNDIEDVEPLWNLSSLETLKLAGNPIDWTTHLYQLEDVHGTEIDIEVSVPWDVNEDGSVNTSDSAGIGFLIALGVADPTADEDSGRLKRSILDVNFDGNVDQDDIDLVIANYDEGVARAPSLLDVSALSLLDVSALKRLEPVVLELRLEQLRAESDGSLKYLQAIALLESVLAELRPDETILLANYPNPFNPETWLPYHLANASDVRITIYDARGSVVRRLGLGHQTAGYYTSRSRAAYWDGANAVGERVASGIYFYQLEADNHSFLRKMLILK